MLRDWERADGRMLAAVRWRRGARLQSVCVSARARHTCARVPLARHARGRSPSDDQRRGAASHEGARARGRSALDARAAYTTPAIARVERCRMALARAAALCAALSLVCSRSLADASGGASAAHGDDGASAAPPAASTPPSPLPSPPPAGWTGDTFLVRTVSDEASRLACEQCDLRAPDCHCRGVFERVLTGLCVRGTQAAIADMAHALDFNISYVEYDLGTSRCVCLRVGAVNVRVCVRHCARVVACQCAHSCACSQCLRLTQPRRARQGCARDSGGRVVGP